MGLEPIDGWTRRSSQEMSFIEYPCALGFTQDGERLVAIDANDIAFVAVLQEGRVTDFREDLADDEPDDDRTTFGYPSCDGRPVHYSSFDVQNLPLEAPGGWRLEPRDVQTDDFALYLCGPSASVRLLDLGAGWADTFIAGFSPCGRYLAVRDLGCLDLFSRDAAFAEPQR